MDVCKDGKIQLPDKISELVTCRKTAKRQTKEGFNAESGYMRGIPDGDLQKDTVLMQLGSASFLFVCVAACLYLKIWHRRHNVCLCAPFWCLLLQSQTAN